MDRNTAPRSLCYTLTPRIIIKHYMGNSYMKKTTTLLLCTAALLSTNTLANDFSGWYIGGGMGTTDFHDGGFSDDYLVLSKTKFEGDGNSTHIYAGYTFNRIFSLEAAYSKYGDVMMKQVGKSDSTFLTPTSLSLSANLGYTFDSGLRPFALIGLGYMDLQQQSIKLLDEDAGASIHWGFGVEYSFGYGGIANKGLTLRAAYQADTVFVDPRPNNNSELEDMYAWTTGSAYLGASFKF